MANTPSATEIPLPSTNSIPSSKEGGLGTDPPDAAAQNQENDRDDLSDGDFVEYRDGQRVYRCRWNDCEQVFQVHDDLIKHVNDHAENLRKKGELLCGWLNCPRKGVSQASRFALLIHIRGHTGEKPFRCDACQKAFKRSDALSKHKTKCPQTLALQAAAAPEPGKLTAEPSATGAAPSSAFASSVIPDTGLPMPESYEALMEASTSSNKQKYTLQKAKYRQLKVERRILQDEYESARKKLMRLKTQNDVALEKLTGKVFGGAQAPVKVEAEVEDQMMQD